YSDLPRRSTATVRRHISSPTSRAGLRPRGTLFAAQQLAEPRACAVQPRLESALFQTRHLHQLGERIALDVVQREERALVLVETLPRAVELARPLRGLGLLRRAGSVRGEADRAVHLDRIDMRAIETAQLIDEDPPHHA